MNNKKIALMLVIAASCIKFAYSKEAKYVKG